MAEAQTPSVRKLGTRTDKSAEEAVSLAAEAAEKERIMQVLGMGLVTDAIRVKDADPNRRYAYVRDRDIDIQRFEALGYTIETEKGKGTHGTGDNRRRVGDVILMSVDRDRYNLIEQVKRERVATRMDAPPSVKEYKDKASVAAARGEAAPPIDLTEGS